MLAGLMPFARHQAGRSFSKTSRSPDTGRSLARWNFVERSFHRHKAPPLKIRKSFNEILRDVIRCQLADAFCQPRQFGLWQCSDFSEDLFSGHSFLVNTPN